MKNLRLNLIAVCNVLEEKYGNTVLDFSQAVKNRLAQTDEQIKRMRDWKIYLKFIET